jgi:hypothetical protein
MRAPASTRSRLRRASRKANPPPCHGAGQLFSEPPVIIQRIVKQVLCAIAIAALAELPISASAAPSPSPALGAVLAAPPAGYVLLGTGTFHGQFTATDYAKQYQSKVLEAGLTLIHDGFVDGYGMTWVQRSTHRVLIEFVIAFGGARGAKSWLGYEEASDKSDPGYKHSDAVAGIDSYYGVHRTFTSPTGFADAFSFVKGNDMFGVGFVSAKDDVLKLATAQTRKQYAAAPDQTIPTAKWTENAPSQRPQTNFLGAIIGVVLVLVIIGGVVRLVMVRRRGSV